MIWDDLVERDLRLAIIQDIARKMRALSRTPRDRECDYATIKRLGSKCVGQFSGNEDPVLAKPEAWSVFIAQMCEDMNR